MSICNEHNILQNPYVTPTAYLSHHPPRGIPHITLLSIAHISPLRSSLSHHHSYVFSCYLSRLFSHVMPRVASTLPSALSGQTDFTLPQHIHEWACIVIHCFLIHHSSLSIRIILTNASYTPPHSLIHHSSSFFHALLILAYSNYMLFIVPHITPIP